MTDGSPLRFARGRRSVCDAPRPRGLPTLAHCVKRVLLVACAVLISGCSGEAERKVALRRSNLAALAVGYQQYYAEQGRAPSNAAELAQFMSAASDSSAVKDAVKSLEDADVVMFWNGVLDQSGENGQRTLGFEASVPGSGGYVVTADGSIRLVTARQFAETPTVEVAEEGPPAADDQ